MGSSISRIGEIDENPAPKVEGGSEPSTPILANKVVKLVKEELDPRSPSNSISRTPIQFLSTPEVDPKKTTPNLVDKLKVLPGEFDPRSPSTDFTRTPILIASDDDKSKIPRKVCNKNLEVVRRVGSLSTPNRRPKSTGNLPVIAPKLLESSPVSPKSVKSKRKSFIGLLETNIDYTETDLDEVLKMKYQSPKNKIEESNLKNIDPRSPTMDFARTPLQILKKIGEINLDDENIEEKPESSNDSPGTRLQNSVDEKIAVENIENDTELKEMENQVEHFENIAESAADSPKEICSETNAVNSMQINHSDNKLTDQSKIVDLTHDVREFDKKLTNLIYEDTTILQTPPRKLPTLSKEGVRTPLGVRNHERNAYNSEPMKKTTNKLKVSDRPRKSEISKIPVFKEKGRRIEGMQCENTPPRQLRERKRMQPVKSQWDSADNTLII